MRSDRQKRVEQRAHDIWVAEGRPHGKHDEHWHRAEREITEEGAGGRAGNRAAGSRAKAAPASKAGASSARAKTAAPAKKPGSTAKPAAAAKAGTASTKGRKRSSGTPSST